LFEIAAKLGSFALQSAYAAGGYFFRFATVAKVTTNNTETNRQQPNRRIAQKM
jgi:hypothetical protein